MEQNRYPDLENKIILVTGSSKALGAETARAFARAGAKVVVHGRDQQAIDLVVASITETGAACIGIAGDTTSAQALERMRAEIGAQFGEIDVLAAFAGGMGDPLPILDMSVGHWRRVIDVDLNSKFLAAKVFAPAMKARGRGNIVLMSSTAGRLVSQASAAYGAAQAAGLMFMRHLAQELGPSGVRVNAIAPSIVRNERIDASMPAAVQAKVAEFLPLRRIGVPQDIAQAALFLASDASSWITGHTIDVNGGKIML